jgi:hypothetical protein
MVRITILIVLTISFLGILLGTNTNAFFADSSNSTANVFAAATSFPTATPSATPTPPIAQTLVMNELLPLSSCIQGQDNGQYLELWNGSGATVNLKDFKLTDGTNTIAISNSNADLLNGQFAILVKSTGIINGCYGGDVNGAVTPNLGGQIDFNTGTLQLLNASNIVLDTLKWGTGQDLQPAINQSIERVPTGKDSALGINFSSSDLILKEVSTPGFGTILVLNEFTPNSATEQVEIFNPSATSVNLTGWTLVDAASTVKSLTPLGIISFNTFKVHNEATTWLNNVGPETIQLKDPTNKIIDSHTYNGSIGAGLSIGRITDAFTTWKQTCTATSVGSTNNGVCQ